MRSLPVRTTLAALGLLALAACSSTGVQPGQERSADPVSRRETTSGVLVGFAASEQSHAWLGVPFAKPPVGELRWRAPLPPDAWTGEREALEIGSACPQFANLLGDQPDAARGSVIGSEDCLYLNVWAPRTAAAGSGQRPVMVWIHGGGNTIGHGGSYDGSRLAAEHDLIVVSVNYRLGPFGWLRHPALVDGVAGVADRSGNYGTLDLVRALAWVRDNASAFGGDAGNVTIFGESAGARNVMSLLVSPASRGLFHRAIVQSGGTRSSSLAKAQNLRDADARGDENSSSEVALRLLFGERAETDRAAATAELSAMPAATLAARLRAATPAEILGLYQLREGLGMFRMPQLIRDGHVLPDDEIPELLASGRYQQLPVMLGSNRDETKLFQFLDPEQVWRLFWFLPRMRDEQRYQLAAEYGSNAWKLRGVDLPARLMRAAQGPSVFAYRFDWDEEGAFLGSDLAKLLGAAHGIEIPFVFGRFEGSFLSAAFDDDSLAGRQELSETMMSYWAEFAYSGDPGRGRDGKLPQWKPWNDSSPDAEKFVVLDTSADGGIAMSGAALTRQDLLAQLAADPRLDAPGARCEFFASLVRASSFEAEDHAAVGCNDPSAPDVAGR